MYKPKSFKGGSNASKVELKLELDSPKLDRARIRVMVMENLLNKLRLDF